MTIKMNKILASEKIETVCETYRWKSGLLCKAE